MQKCCQLIHVHLDVDVGIDVDTYLAYISNSLCGQKSYAICANVNEKMDLTFVSKTGLNSLKTN